MAVYLGKDKIAGISTSQPAENNNLKLPEIAPGVQQIVSINSDGTQQNLTLGEGVSIENGVLSASGGGKLYNHQISFAPAKKGSVTIVNTSAELFDKTTLPMWLYEKGYKGLTSKTALLAKQCVYPVISEMTMDGILFLPIGIYSTDGTQIGLYSHNFDMTAAIFENEYNDGWYGTLYGITDTVSEL